MLRGSSQAWDVYDELCEIKRDMWPFGFDVPFIDRTRFFASFLNED